MDRNHETVDGLLGLLDDAIDSYYAQNAVIESEFQRNGFRSDQNHLNYSARRTRTSNLLKEKSAKIISELDILTRKIRSTQPLLVDLNRGNLNLKRGFPRRLPFGEYLVTSDMPTEIACFNVQLRVPRMLSFPPDKPVRIDRHSDIPFFHQLLLRLASSLPVDKQQYYFFDPRGLGRSVAIFNRLFSNNRLVPQQRVMMSAQELKESLRHVQSYIRDLYAHSFCKGCGDNWADYNRYWFERNERRKMLPCMVFVFMDVPAAMDPDCFHLFCSMVEHCGKCGILVLFSCDEAIWSDNTDRIRSNMEQELLTLAKTRCVHPAECFSSLNFRYLKLETAEETMPGAENLRRLMEDLSDAARIDLGSMFSLTEMLHQRRPHPAPPSADCGEFEKGISFPIGYEISGGELARLEINDRTPHYLIGGTTGSGKSNLLHNLILSVCWNYTPEEVRIYLLDFKEGVEFYQYARPVSLPHAGLVAAEADTEYGVTVLHHLEEELKRRAGMFKKQNCKDIAAYHQKNPKCHMPRILVIIDEFQVLFESEQKAGTLETMTRIAKQGRSAGVHLILATQSLKGIADFTSIATQFSGRIALKCAAEDSKLLLGGITSNNEAASELEIPYAILNTSQGSVAKNFKFAVPEARSEDIRRYLAKLQGEYRNLEPPNIFFGQTYPIFPDSGAFLPKSKEFVLSLGRRLSYEQEMVRISFLDKPEYNLLLCGRNPQIKRGLLWSLLLSAQFSDYCDEIACVGDTAAFAELPDGPKNVTLWDNVYAFAEGCREQWKTRRFLVLFDNRNLIKEAGFPSSPFSASRETDEVKLAMRDFWENANSYGSHFAVFFDSGASLKSSGMPLTDFLYRVVFEVNDSEFETMLGISMGRKPSNRYGRAFMIINQELNGAFRPFMKPEWGEETQ